EPRLAIEAALGLPPAERPPGLVQSVFDQVAASDPHLALSLLDEIQHAGERSNARSSILGQWLYNDPDAALAYLESIDAADAEEVISESGLMLAHRDPDVAMRLLPRVSEAYRPVWRATIAERLAATRGAADAMAFVQRFEGEPGYADLQASVIGGVAHRDLDGARQLADQMTDAGARDRAYAQIVSLQAQYDPAAAAAELGRITDENARANAATSVSHYWFQHDAPAATRWMLGQPPGPLRDQVVRDAVLSVPEMTPDILRLVDEIRDPEVRGQAKAGVAYQLAEEDPAAVRRMLDEGEIPEHFREAVETTLQQAGH
ncbi:MAG TPA: hypothetical protein VFY03_08580, partial [Woeseiaceae bacterium]|nr:hypothetical protein [Woeseiaceae bacterium]